MNAAWLAWLVGLAIVGTAMGETKAGKVPVSELLDNPSTFDGHAVVLQGILTRLQVYVTRKGNRYYTFELIQDRRNVLVVVHDRPSCKAGTVVRVQGRFDAAEKHVDATTVRCAQPSASDQTRVTAVTVKPRAG